MDDSQKSNKAQRTAKAVAYACDETPDESYVEAYEETLVESYDEICDETQGESICDAGLQSLSALQDAVIAELKAELAERHSVTFAELEAALAERDAILAEKDTALAENAETIANLMAQLE